jgi:peptidyl-prolyl cis-trans isomerase SurA
MKRLNFILCGIFIISSLFLNAQEQNKKVLFSINDQAVFTDEFKRVYYKNIDLVKDESQKDLNNYLELFVGYKLKIAKANALGLQNNPKYISELKSYRTQLSKNYITDSKVTEALILEGYERSIKEVEASHILLLVDENAAPKDTLKVYNELLNIRKDILKGADFGEMASQFSEDPSAKENKGYLGYFSGFRMVYPFESAAYKTPIGNISMPIRTRFGYHLIKVTDVRPHRGELTVSHIMITPNQEGATRTEEEMKSIIFDIYKKIQQGENFEALAKQFSEDKSSAAKGGQLNRFGAGQLSADAFEQVAFALTTDRPISEPVQTQYGWHIIKLIEKHPVKTFEASRLDIEKKVARDDRARLIAESMTEQLKNKYRIIHNNKLLQDITKTVTPAFLNSEWNPKFKKEWDQTILVIDQKKITGKMFVDFLLEEQKVGYVPQDVSKLIQQLYDLYLERELNAYYDANLEKEFPEFAAVMEEYRDGLLLFELMEQEIWNKSKTDTLGYTKYFQNNIGNYQWKDRYNIVLLSSKDSKKIKEAHKLMRKGKSVAEIKSKINTDDQVFIMDKVGVFESGSDALPKKAPLNLGLNPIFEDEGYFYVLNILEINPAGPKKIEECRGRVINDYQQFLESNWLDRLKSEFTIAIDQKVFEDLKSEMNNK